MLNNFGLSFFVRLHRYYIINDAQLHNISNINLFILPIYKLSEMQYYKNEVV